MLKAVYSETFDMRMCRSQWQEIVYNMQHICITQYSCEQQIVLIGKDTISANEENDEIYTG